MKGLVRRSVFLEFAVYCLLHLDRILNPGEQDLSIWGLGEEIIASRFDPPDPVFLFSQGGHKYDWDQLGFLFFLQEATNSKPVHPWHHDIQEDQVRSFGSGLCECFFPVGGTHRLVAKVFQLLLQDIDIKRFVIDRSRFFARRSP